MGGIYLPGTMSFCRWRTIVKYWRLTQVSTQHAKKFIFLKAVRGLFIISFLCPQTWMLSKIIHTVGRNDEQLGLVLVCVCVWEQSKVLRCLAVQTPFTFSPSLLDGDCSFKRRLFGSSFFSPDLIQTPISLICTDRCGNSLTSKNKYEK